MIKNDTFFRRFRQGLLGIFAWGLLTGCQQIADRVSDWVALALAPPAPASLPVIFPDANDGPKPSPPTHVQDCPDCPRLVMLPAGQVLMGSPEDEIGRDEDESPQRWQALPTMAMGQTEVTRAQWQAFERDTGYRAASGCLTRSPEGYVHEPHLGWRYPGFDQTGEHPVVCINWSDAQAYVQWLSRKTKQRYRLPTEREWEYAARAGVSAPYPWQGGVNRLCEHANGADARLSLQRADLPAQNCDDGFPYTAPVGSFSPNAWGLFDMHGNAMEWVEDCWTAQIPEATSQATPLHCRSRVTRGGGWDLTPQYLRSAYRGKASSINRGTAIGFRVVRQVP